MRIFQNLNKFSSEGSFEGWMHRIMINQCLMKLRKNKVFHLNVDDYFIRYYLEELTSQKIEEDDIMKLI